MASGGRTYRRRRLPSLSPVTSLGRAVGMTFFVITIFPKASVPIDDSPQEENAYFERYDRAYALSRGTLAECRGKLEELFCLSLFKRLEN